MGFWGWFSRIISKQPQEGVEDQGSIATAESPRSRTKRISGSRSQPHSHSHSPSDNEETRPWWDLPDPSEPPLYELTAPQRPEFTTEARAIENMLITHFDGRNLTLPSLPRVPERVLQMLSGHRDMRLVAKEISNDQVSAAAVLRMSNSVLYSGLQKITTIEQATVRLGSNTIRMIMLNLSMRSITSREQRKDNNRAERLWQRSLASATIMRLLADVTKVNPEEAFLIGLLHNVGNIIVLRIINGQRDRLKIQINDPTFEFLCHETHQEFGELLAGGWSLPERLKSLICDHHAYPVPNQPFRLERLHLQMTEMISSLLGYIPLCNYDLLSSRAVRDLGLADRADFIEFLNELPDKINEAMATLS